MKRNRRTFMKATAAGLAAWSTSDELPAANGDKPKSFVPALDALKKQTGMRIDKIETYTQSSTVSIVRIVADNGLEGFGQIAPFDADLSATVLHRKIAPLVLGRDPGDFEQINETCIEKNYKFPWSFVCRALAGADTAIWDLLGKMHKKSVCELLGGRPRPMPVYGSSMRRDIKPRDEADRLKKLHDQLGYGAFKVRLGKVTGHDEDQWQGRTEELIPTMRQTLGPKVRLLSDSNSCYSPRKAIAVGRLLEESDYCHYEEPCPYWELEWTAEVAAALKVPVAGGEQDNDLAQWRRMIRMNAVDIVQPDICYIGGLTRALQVARFAAAAAKPCVPHSANLSMVTVFTLHMMGAIPNAGDHIEYSIEDTAWTRGLFDPALKVVDGKVAIPADTGWGVVVHSDWLKKATRQTSERR